MMINTKKIYRLFVRNCDRLNDSPEILQMVALTYIFSEVPPESIVRLLKEHPNNTLVFFNEKALDDDEILIQTIKIIALLETCRTLEEFNTLHENKKEIMNESNKQKSAFDRFLKGIMQVPKPKNDEPS